MEWDIICTDCNERHPQSLAHRNEHDLVELIHHAEAIAAIDDLRRVVDLQLLLGFGTDGRVIYTSWFKQHLGHNLVPINEYGTLMGVCGRGLQCPTCRYGIQQKCTLAYGHEGPCEPAKLVSPPR